MPKEIKGNAQRKPPGDVTDVAGLPFVDEHARVIRAPRAEVWAAVEKYWQAVCCREQQPLMRLLGTDPPAGFRITETAPLERLSLAGRHRFARYELVFVLSDAGEDATRLAALTYAAFPRLRGRLYRLLVITSGAHAVAARRLRRSVERRVSPTYR